MSRHRAAPPRRAEPLSVRHRAQRPRYGRIGMLVAAVTVTAVAMLGGVGVLPSVATGSDGPSRAVDTSTASADSPLDSPTSASALTLAGKDPTSAEPSADPSAGSSAPSATPTTPASAETAAGGSETAQPSTPAADPSVPADSGEGRRIVFSQSEQRVWLVDQDETVERTYPVSGSVYDNLDPGTYAVYSRSEQAHGIDDSGSMKYFVRFTEGDNGAAIGFHDIPIKDGDLIQTVAQLGTPLSHGCIRQERPDAIALWDFAPIGTEVDVTA